MSASKFNNVNNGLLVLFVALSGWAFVTAYRFPARDAMFPQIASAFILGGALLLLGIQFLPAQLRNSIEGDDDLFDTDDVVEEGVIDPGELNHRKRYMLIGLVAVYLAVGYLIGLFWATPLFVLAYSVLTNQDRTITAILTVLSLLIAYTFMSILNLSIDTGVITVGL